MQFLISIWLAGFVVSFVYLNVRGDRATGELWSSIPVLTLAGMIVFEVAMIAWMSVVWPAFVSVALEKVQRYIRT